MLRRPKAEGDVVWDTAGTGQGIFQHPPREASGIKRNSPEQKFKPCSEYPAVIHVLDQAGFHHVWYTISAAGRPSGAAAFIIREITFFWILEHCSSYSTATVSSRSA